MASKKDILENIGAKVSVHDCDDAVILKGFIVAEREQEFVVAIQKVLDADLSNHVTYKPVVDSAETLKKWVAEGDPLESCVTPYLSETLFEYHYFNKKMHQFSIDQAIKIKPRIYSPSKCFNENFTLPVEFFGCSEDDLVELDRIIVTSIGSENFYYNWRGMQFVSKKYMIENSDQLKLGIAKIESKSDGQHVIYNEMDSIVNIEQWFKDYTADAQACLS